MLAGCYRRLNMRNSEYISEREKPIKTSTTSIIIQCILCTLYMLLIGTQTACVNVLHICACACVTRVFNTRISSERNCFMQAPKHRSTLDTSAVWFAFFCIKSRCESSVDISRSTFSQATTFNSSLFRRFQKKNPSKWNSYCWYVEVYFTIICAQEVKVIVQTLSRFYLKSVNISETNDHISYNVSQWVFDLNNIHNVQSQSRSHSTELPHIVIIVIYWFVCLHLQTLLAIFAVLALVSAVPVDETIGGDVYGSDNLSPQDPNEFLKLKKLKKLLFG